MQRCLSAIAAAVPPDASVVEYYAGCGVIGLSLAAAGVARQVVCVEVNPDSKKAFEVTAAQLAKSNKVRFWMTVRILPWLRVLIELCCILVKACA